jgi:hypothetical protein
MDRDKDKQVAEIRIRESEELVETALQSESSSLRSFLDVSLLHNNEATYSYPSFSVQ